MFSLLYGFWEYLFNKVNYFVLILGLDNSGKSTFLEHAKCNLYRNHRHVDLTRIASTVGLNVGKLDTNGVVLNFWDLGGQKELQLLWDKYFLEAHGIIWVVDSSDRDRLEESVELFTKIITNELLIGLPLLFIINKQDLSTAMKPSEIMYAYKKSLELIGNRCFLTIPTSALVGSGINESISWIGAQVKVSPRPPTEI